MKITLTNTEASNFIRSVFNDAGIPAKTVEIENEIPPSNPINDDLSQSAMARRAVTLMEFAANNTSKLYNPDQKSIQELINVTNGWKLIPAGSGIIRYQLAFNDARKVLRDWGKQSYQLIRGYYPE